MLSIVLMAFHVHAARVSLSWTAPTTNQDNTSLNDLAGYQVYYGLALRFYDVAVDVGLATSAVLSDLEAGRTYYFAVTADDTSGNESVFSTEVPYAIPLTDNACGFANLALCATASASSAWSAGYEAAQATDDNGGRAGIVPMGTRPGPGWRWTWALSPPLIPSCSRKPSTASRASACSTGVGAPGATLCQATASEPPKGIPLQP